MAASADSLVPRATHQQRAANKQQNKHRKVVPATTPSTGVEVENMEKRDVSAVTTDAVALLVPSNRTPVTAAQQILQQRKRNIEIKTELYEGAGCTHLVFE